MHLFNLLLYILEQIDSQMNDKKSRTNKITVRLNDIELAQLQDYADKMQLPVAETVRQLIQKLKWCLPSGIARQICD